MSLKKKVKSVRAEEHHRRARSLDGVDDNTNISYVPWNKHKAWHVWFGNMNAYQICELLNQEKTPDGFKLVCKFINGNEVLLKGGKESHNPKKKNRAWEILFEGLSFEEIIKYINQLWLDPSYHLYIKKV